MIEEKRKRKKRICHFAVVLCAALLMGQLASFLPERAHAETPGETLVVRVGYFGDTKDYRVKASLSRAQLEALGAETHEYSNVTRVGTVMGTIARGPAIVKILDAAGIDRGSAQVINLRTTDGNQQENNWFVSLNMDVWVNQTRYFYPNLRANYECRNPAVFPLKGALESMKPVPAILAIESYSSKSSQEKLDPSTMSESNSYRFCTGQGAIAEETDTTDYSSMNSAKWIFGIDVTLYGSPSDAVDLRLDLDNPKLKVGSEKKITAVITGQDLFEDKVGKKLKWTSSDPSIASVDKNGVVTVHKKGTVTITAATENGIRKSITINGVEKAKKDNEEKAAAVKEKKKPPKEKKQTASTKDIREIVLGDAVAYEREAMSEDAKALPKQESDPMAVAYAAYGGGICLTLGALVKLLLYLREV